MSEASEGTLILAASAKGEAARESDRLQGGIYTHYLLEAGMKTKIPFMPELMMVVWSHLGAWL